MAMTLACAQVLVTQGGRGVPRGQVNAGRPAVPQASVRTQGAMDDAAGQMRHRVVARAVHPGWDVGTLGRAFVVQEMRARRVGESVARRTSPAETQLPFCAAIQEWRTARA